MEQQLKQRLSGTVVLVAVAVIVLPLLLNGEGYRALQRIEIDAPQRPLFNYRQKDFTIPLQELNEQTDLLNPPQPMDIKGFDDNKEEAVYSEEDNIGGRSVPMLEPSAKPPTANSELTTTWVVQVGSFSVEANALEVHKNLAAMNTENIAAEIETEKVNGQDIYVVKVISDDYAALSKVAELIKKDYPDAFIKERE